MFKKVLIANRGEIAVRIIQACQEMGIATVTIYSEADISSLHVQRADESVLIGPAPALESYLKYEKIIETAKKTGAEAIHPGYGFLAENAAFARACAEANIIFIGPSAEAIQKMGDKRESKAIMEKAKIPVVPGYYGQNQSPGKFIQEAGKIGYPVMIKASAGGGGKGMRIVHRPQDMTVAVDGAKRESLAAFNDQTVLLEKYIENPRHIEFQILADLAGNTVHLFERECSIQRRHQKVIEETPSVVLTPELRRQMGDIAIKAAKAVKYVNAGTVEFIFDEKTQTFYFLEMNTRLQVEHSVTELTTGIDLVHCQLRIAAGENLSLAQDDVSQHGHAIEVRIYAEDPVHDFLPQTGTIQVLEPPNGPQIRNDLGIHANSEVTFHYDPLLAKLTVSGGSRPEAIDRLRWALQQYSILGIRHNMDFLIDVIDHPKFREGHTTTHFIEQHMNDWQEQQTDLPDEALISAAIAEMHLLEQPKSTQAKLSSEGDLYNPWQQKSGWRN